jgi:hypothetical protein
MNLTEIREILTKKGAYSTTNKDLLREWLAQDCVNLFNTGLTLMPKKVFYKHIAPNKAVADGDVFRKMTKRELEKASFNFIHILNKLVYKNSYKREKFNKRLPVVMTIEGEKSFKDLHSHFAIGKPETMDLMEFKRLVKKAVEMSGDFHVFDPSFEFEKHNLDQKYRYKLDLIDRDWLYYITKELDRKALHNLYLP